MPLLSRDERVFRLVPAARLASGGRPLGPGRPGRARGTARLGRAGASRFPRGARIDPSTTIMALADCVAERVRRERPALEAPAA